MVLYYKNIFNIVKYFHKKSQYTKLIDQTQTRNTSLINLSVIHGDICKNKYLDELV